MEMKLFLILLGLIHFKFYSCSGDLQSKYGDSDSLDIEIEEVDEWQRYINYNRKMAQRFLKKKETTIVGRNTKKGKRIIAPLFMLSRTKSNLIVKQLESGSQSQSNGGFEFPKQPMLFSNVHFRNDGSITPVIKLSKTEKGVVGKKLEFGRAKKSGVNWDSQDGTVKIKIGGRSGMKIDQNGVINVEAGINKEFPNGDISVRGTIILKVPAGLKASDINAIEAISDDNSYGEYPQTEEREDTSYEKEDKYYDDPNEDKYGDTSDDKIIRM